MSKYRSLAFHMYDERGPGMQSETCPLTRVHTPFEEPYLEEAVHGLEQDLKPVSMVVDVRDAAGGNQLVNLGLPELPDF
jgi:hypothetical protein